MDTEPVTTPTMDHHTAQARMERLGRVLDDWVTIPGIGYKVGIDSVIGLVPVVGDAVSAVLGSYLIYEGKRLGAPKATLLKMAGNVGADLLIGLIPGVGDLADFAFKSNSRNLRLLQQHVDGLAPPQPTAAPVTRRSRALLFALGALLLGAVAWWLVL